MMPRRKLIFGASVHHLGKKKNTHTHFFHNLNVGLNHQKLIFLKHNYVFSIQYLVQQRIRCLIMTSGTLAPLIPLINELDIPFPVRLTNPHIVKQLQVCVKIVGRGPDDKQLISNFQNRYRSVYRNGLHLLLLTLSIPFYFQRY